jgi:transposase
MKCFVGAKPLHDHRGRIVQHFLQQEAVQTIPWPAMSPDMNPIEHAWDFIGRKINQRNPKCQNIDELRTAINASIVRMCKA